MCGLNARVGGLSRTMQPFRVSINEKGGDCWIFYSKNVLVIDGKNISKPNLKREEDEKA